MPDDLRGVAIRRLYHQRIAQTRFNLPGEMLAWLGAVQGQDYAGAKWSLGLRLPGSTEAEIEQAIVDKTILRSWILRGTLHFVAAEDIHWLVGLVAGGLIKGNARRYRELELDEHTLARSNDLLARALQGGVQRSRTELFSFLEQNGISTQGQRGVFMLQRAALDGLIVQGALHGRDTTFLALDEAPSKAKKMGREAALAELAGRYFTSRGPATLQDFVWWSGLAATEARVGLDSLRAQLAQETVDGQTYWFSPSGLEINKSSPTVSLLPGFDEYLLAYKDRIASLDVPHYKRLTPPNGMLPATIVSQGRVIGTWKRTFKKDTVVILPSPFEALSVEESQAFAAAAKRYGEFLGLQVGVSEA